jgi:hypothetical protein
VPADLEDLAVAHALDRSAVAPMSQVDGSAKLARDEHGAGRLVEKPVHPAALVGLEMPEDHIGNPLGSSTSATAARTVSRCDFRAGCSGLSLEPGDR